MALKHREQGMVDKIFSEAERSKRFVSQKQGRGRRMYSYTIKQFETVIKEGEDGKQKIKRKFIGTIEEFIWAHNRGEAMAFLARRHPEAFDRKMAG